MALVPTRVWAGSFDVHSISSYILEAALGLHVTEHVSTPSNITTVDLFHHMKTYSDGPSLEPFPITGRQPLGTATTYHSRASTAALSAPPPLPHLSVEIDAGLLPDAVFELPEPDTTDSSRSRRAP